MDDLRDTYQMACPKCGQDDELIVEITCQAVLTAEGTEPFGDHEWDDDSFCRCRACKHIGTVAEFTAKAEAREPS